jgi:acetyl esterase
MPGDEGASYARKLSRAGVPVAQVRYGGTIHDFVMLNLMLIRRITSGED